MKKTLFAVVCALAFFAGTAPIAAQATGTLRGVVQDAVTGRPLAGAQVSVAGTTLGGLSNEQGRYLLLNVPVGTQTLRVVFIGYRNSEQTVDVVAGQVTTSTILMGQTAISLDEIVVTGTAGATEKRSLGNSVTRVESEKIVADAGLQSVNELLTARAPGVSLTNMSGQAGTAARVRIRGAGSLNAGLDPVYYVDGVRIAGRVADGYSTSNGIVQGTSPLDAIAPTDIESIEVIKGPAAATLYGAEAAGGVIQIITKKGKAGQGVQFTAELQSGQTDWHLAQPMNYTLCTVSADAAALGMSTEPVQLQLRQPHRQLELAGVQRFQREPAPCRAHAHGPARPSGSQSSPYRQHGRREHLRPGRRRELQLLHLGREDGRAGGVLQQLLQPDRAPA